MKILAFEFSSDQRSVAVVDATGGTPVLLSLRTETGTRSVKALALVEAALREANVPREDIGCLALGIGPGSYAGIRVSIALAQGWQLARGVRLLGVSSVEAMVGQAHELGLRGRVHAAIDAQRQEAYLATYELSEAGGKETSALRLAPMSEAQALVTAGEVVIGPEVDRWCQGARVVFPSAKHIGMRAAGRTDFVTGEALAPIYLRAISFVKAPPSRVIPA